MNEFLKSTKPEILIEQRLKLHRELAYTTANTTITTTIITATNTSAARTVKFERAKRKRSIYPHRTKQQKVLLHSLLFLLLITIDSATGSLSEAIASTTTAGQNRFSKYEIELLRKAFLRKFGMKEQPKQAKPSLPVPDYMWQIYENVKSEDVEWVRHYYPQNSIESGDSTLLLQYDLAVTVQNVTNELVNRANVKLKLKNEKCRRHIKIYEIDQRNPEIWRLLDAKFVESDSREDYQWIDLDVTEALRRRRSNMNRVDFAVELSGSLNQATYPSTSSESTIFSSLPYSRKQTAALVVYVQTIDGAVKVRKKRKANARRRHQHKKHNHRPADRNYCRRTELLVDFNELNWQDWILAPSSYSAYQCQGICPNPLTSHFNTTNHAIVQGLINSVDPNLVPAPCCVPIEMESLAILYIDVEGKIVIKNYPDMEVLSCGCR